MARKPKGQEAPGRPVPGEIAAATRPDLAAPFVGELLRPGDPILARLGHNLDAYEKILEDDQVKSTFQQRRLAVIAREWVVEPGGTSAADTKAADFLREQLQQIAWDSISHKMLAGVFYGYAVGECLWMRDGSSWGLESIKIRRQKRFRFAVDGSLRLMTRDRPQGEVMPPRKFWVMSTGGDHDDDPYGRGLAHWLYWPVFFKRGGMRAWLIFLDKFGQPTVVGKHPPGALEEERAKLLQAAQAVATSTAITMPDGMMLELLEAARSGTPDYKTLHDRMNEAIAKVVLSQTMTTDDGSSLAQAQVHAEVKDEVVKADADMLSGSFNLGPVRWMTEWNFPAATPPRVWRRVEDDPDLKPVADKDKVLFDMGYRLTPEAVKETYGEGYELKEPSDPAPGSGPGQAGETENGPPAPAADDAAFAEQPADALDGLVAAAIADGGWEAQVEPIVGPLRRLADEAESLQELRVRLATVIESLDAGALADRLARSAFIARLAGTLDAPIAGDGEDV